MFKHLRMIAPLSVRYTPSHPRPCVAVFASFGSALRPRGVRHATLFAIHQASPQPARRLP
jgi:hypothetical protein